MGISLIGHSTSFFFFFELGPVDNLKFYGLSVVLVYHLGNSFPYCFFLCLVVQSLSCVRLFATPCTTAHQASLSFTISRSFFKLMPIELVMPSNHLILCCPLLLLPSIFPTIRVFSSGGQSIGASTSAFAMNTQDWFLLRWTGLISLFFKGLSRVLSSTTIWEHQFFGAQPSLWFNSHICTWLLENHSFDYTDLCW